MGTYLDYYKSEICPKIEALDIFLKSQSEPYSWNEVAKVLDISYKQLVIILEEHKLKLITKGVFFYLLHKFEPNFSVMLSREMQHSNKDIYSIEEISYIYLIDLEYIQEVAQNLGKMEFSHDELTILFDKIGRK